MPRIHATLVAGVIAVGLAVPAAAVALRSYDGQDYSEDFNSVRQVRICDREADGNYAYANYLRTGSGTTFRITSPGSGSCASTATGNRIYRHEACEAGTEQSPIDLTGAVEASDADLPDLTFDYHPSALALMDNGHTVQAAYDPGSTLVVDGETYELKQFHFHAHSEHTVDGKAAPLELHLVHAREDDQGVTHLAVVGVLIVEGAENPAYASVLDHLPTEVTEEPEAVDGQTVDAAALLPTDRTFFHYEGSLTTPPCSEGVSWQVMTTPVELSAGQIAAFTARYDDDFRPVQPLGDRELEVSGT